MADPLFDQVSATTLAEMQRDVLADNFFIDGAWQRLTHYYSAERPFTGGLFMQIPFQYDRVNGGAYQPYGISIGGILVILFFCYLLGWLR